MFNNGFFSVKTGLQKFMRKTNTLPRILVFELTSYHNYLDQGTYPSVAVTYAMITDYFIFMDQSFCEF